MSGRSERWLGVFMLLGSGICFSISGVLIRLIESATVWQVVFYRSASWALAMSLQSRTICAYGVRGSERHGRGGNLQQA